MDENAPIPEDMNELREQLFATSRRLGKLKQEYARRQREARKGQQERFDQYLRDCLKDPNKRIFDGKA